MKGALNMSNMQIEAIRYIKQLPESRLNSALEYLRFLCEQVHLPDDFDYALARQADEDTSEETIAFEVLLQDLGISYEELQEN